MPQGDLIVQDVSALLGIAAAPAIGAASPGPSFVLVARTAAGSSRANALGVALGMGVGGLVFAVAALLGLHGLFHAVPSLYLALKLAGGLYLAWLGVGIWRRARHPLLDVVHGQVADARSVGHFFILGLTTQLSNPKTAIVYASVFAAFLPVAPTLAFDLGVVCLTFVIEAGWYALVALALSSAAARAGYLRGKVWVDRVAGGVMLTLGLRFAVSASRP